MARSGRSRSGAPLRKRSVGVKSPGLKQDPEFSSAAKRALAFRRFWVFLLAVALLTIGIVSACGVRLF